MAQHSVTLTWTASTDMPSVIPAGDGYNVFRGVAPTTPGATPINSAVVAANEYIDTNVTPGVSYDYYVTAVIGGNQSPDSQLVTAPPVPIFPPTGLLATSA